MLFLSLPCRRPGKIRCPFRGWNRGDLGPKTKQVEPQFDNEVAKALQKGAHGALHERRCSEGSMHYQDELDRVRVQSRPVLDVMSL